MIALADKINGPDQVRKHLPALSKLSLIRSKSMAESQPISAAATPQLIDSAVQYRELPGFPGYRAGNDGTIWSCWARSKGGTKTRQVYVRSSRWKKLATRRHSQGYRMVGLKNVGGVYKIKYVHHLVLEAFVGPKPDGLLARHKNDVQDDNRLENLIWGTSTENILDRNANKPEATPKGSRHWRARLDPDKVRLIRTRLTNGESPYAIAPEFGVSASSIYDIMDGKTWKHVI